MVLRTGFNFVGGTMSRRYSHPGSLSHIVKPVVAVSGRFLASFDSARDLRYETLARIVRLGAA